MYAKHLWSRVWHRYLPYFRCRKCRRSLFGLRRDASPRYYGYCGYCFAARCEESCLRCLKSLHQKNTGRLGLCADCFISEMEQGRLGLYLTNPSVEADSTMTPWDEYELERELEEGEDDDDF